MRIFDFYTVGEKIYRSKTAINRSLTGKNRRGSGECVWISDYRVWYVTAKRDGHVKRNR